VHCARARAQSVTYTIAFSHTPRQPTNISTLSLHDALPILSNSPWSAAVRTAQSAAHPARATPLLVWPTAGLIIMSCQRLVLPTRSEEHTSELQSHLNIVCRLLLAKKNMQN